MNPDNARIPRITAAAGTELADAYSPRTLVGPPVALIAPGQKQFIARRAVVLHAAWLDQNSFHCPISLTAASRRSLGRVSVPVWGLPLRTPRHRRHGGPSPRHQANATRANPVPPQLWRSPDAGAPRHGGLDPVSRTCPPGRGMLLTRYAPFRRSPPPNRRRSGALPLDLHVLGLPLAFILSQDQTLHRMIYDISICYFALSDPGPASSR